MTDKELVASVVRTYMTKSWARSFLANPEVRESLSAAMEGGESLRTAVREVLNSYRKRNFNGWETEPPPFETEEINIVTEEAKSLGIEGGPGVKHW